MATQNSALEANQTLHSAVTLTGSSQQSSALKLRETGTASPSVAAPKVELTYDYTKGGETSGDFSVQIDPGDAVKYDVDEVAVSLTATGTERTAVFPILPHEQKLYSSVIGTGGTPSGTITVKGELVGPTRPIR